MVDLSEFAGVAGIPRQKESDNMTRLKHRGFSLIELMIVITIAVIFVIINVITVIDVASYSLDI